MGDRDESADAKGERRGVVSKGDLDFIDPAVRDGFEPSTPMPRVPKFARFRHDFTRTELFRE
jgi:hypothetical protein